MTTKTSLSLRLEQEGLWGRMHESAAPAIRFVRKINGRVEAISYPCDSLSRWRWVQGDPEILEILAGNDAITVTGNNFDRLVDTLDQGKLAVLSEMSAPPIEPGIYVASIVIAPRKL